MKIFPIKRKYFFWSLFLGLLSNSLIISHGPKEAAIKEEIEKINEEPEPKAEKLKEEAEVIPPTYGNFALPSTQWPGPNFSFGQNINDKKSFAVYEFTDQFKECGGKFIDLVTWVLYNMTDNDSVLLSIPIEVELEECGSRSSGIGDISLQFEHAFYNRSTHTAYDYATIVANVSFPTGSANKIPATGLGVSSFFFGVTAAHMATDWYVFTSYGTLLPTKDSIGNKPGNAFLYEFGVCHNLCAMKDYIFTLMVELNGVYAVRDRVEGVVDCNSGGNIVWFGPTFYAASKHFSFEVGAQIPVSQHLFGVQNAAQSRSDVVIGWATKF